MPLLSLPDASAYLLYNDSLLDPSYSTGLWLCTDEKEAAAVGINAACLPIGAPEENLARSLPFLEAFPCVLVVGADEARRRALGQALQRQCPSLEVCISVQSAYRGCSSIQELRDTYGLSAVDELWVDCDPLPPYGLLEISAVEQVDLARQPKALSGIPALDQLIGGFYDGEVSVWTGKRKEGKSTLLGLVILAAIREGRRVCVYSGELPAWRYKAWLLAMAAGPANLLEETTDTGKTTWSCRSDVAAQIELWWRGRLFLLDNTIPGIHSAGTLLGVMRHAKKRFGCSCFVLDNLMTVDLAGEDYYRAQSRFVGQLVDFAHDTSAHVHLVAHRRKGGAGKGKADSDDVSGSGDITNRADNTFAVSRSSDENDPFDAKLEIQANRGFGETGVIGLKFDVRSRRFYQSNVNWKCGWESSAEDAQTMLQELPGDDPDNPFL